MKTYAFVRVVFERATGLMMLLILLGGSTIAFCGPIHDAARKGEVNKIKALLQADPKLVADQDKNGDTPLHLACLHSQLAAAQVLIEAGADVNARNNYGAFTPGDLSAVFSSSNHQDPVSLLTVHGVDSRDMKNGYTPLHLCLFANHHKELMELLIAKGSDVNAQASSGATPLYFAVLRDQPDDVKFLIEKGANLNLPNAYGGTILDAALQLQYGSMIQILVDHGADVNAKDQSEQRPLAYAAKMDDHKWADLLKKHGAHE
jgi:ankyrin repeat protein